MRLRVQAPSLASARFASRTGPQPVPSPLLFVLAGAPSDAQICASQPLLTALSIGTVASIILRAVGRDGRTALFQMCRDARDSALAASSHAFLQLDITQSLSRVTLPQKLSAVRQRLTTRGKARTTLDVQCGSFNAEPSDRALSSHLLALVPSELQPAADCQSSVRPSLSHPRA